MASILLFRDRLELREVSLDLQHKLSHYLIHNNIH